MTLWVGWHLRLAGHLALLCMDGAEDASAHHAYPYFQKGSTHIVAGVGPVVDAAYVARRCIIAR